MWSPLFILSNQLQGGNLLTTVIGGKRMCGKTTELLKQSAKEGHRILVAHNRVVDILVKKAKELSLEIPQPVAIQRLLVDDTHKGESLLVDEVEWVLSKMTGCQIISMSTSATMIEKEAFNNQIKESTFTEQFTKQVQLIEHIEKETRALKMELLRMRLDDFRVGLYDEIFNHLHDNEDFAIEVAEIIAGYN